MGVNTFSNYQLLPATASAASEFQPSIRPHIWVPPAVLEASIHAVPNGTGDAGKQATPGALENYYKDALRKSDDEVNGSAATQQYPEVHQAQPKKKWFGSFSHLGSLGLGGVIHG